MSNIIIYKESDSLRKNGVMIRIAPDISKKLDELSEESGLSKARVLDKILRAAIPMVKVEE